MPLPFRVVVDHFHDRTELEMPVWEWYVHGFVLEIRSFGLSAYVAPELKDDPLRRRPAHGNSSDDGTLHCLIVGDL